MEKFHDSNATDKPEENKILSIYRNNRQYEIINSYGCMARINEENNSCLVATKPILKAIIHNGFMHAAADHYISTSRSPAALMLALCSPPAIDEGGDFSLSACEAEFADGLNNNLFYGDGPFANPKNIFDFLEDIAAISYYHATIMAQATPEERQFDVEAGDSLTNACAIYAAAAVVTLQDSVIRPAVINHVVEPVAYAEALRDAVLDFVDGCELVFVDEISDEDTTDIKSLLHVDDGPSI